MADVTQCTLCDGQFATGEHLLEIPCGHRYHTACAFRRYATEQYDVLDMRCFEHGCHTHIVPQDVLDMMGDGHGTRVKEEEEVVTYLAESDENFKASIAKIHDAHKLLKHQSAVCRRRAGIITETAKADVAAHVLAVKNRVKEAKKALAASDEYKALGKSSRSFTGLTGANFSRRWGIDFRSVKRILRKKTGNGDIGYVWRYQPSYHMGRLNMRRMLY